MQKGGVVRKIVKGLDLLLKCNYVIISLQFKTKIRPFDSFVRFWEPFKIWTRVSEHPVVTSVTDYQGLL